MGRARRQARDGRDQPRHRRRRLAPEHIVAAGVEDVVLNAGIHLERSDVPLEREGALTPENLRFLARPHVHARRVLLLPQAVVLGARVRQLGHRPQRAADHEHAEPEPEEDFELQPVDQRSPGSGRCTAY